jgi:hypothetical protein
MWPALRPVAHTISYDSRVMGDTRGGDQAALGPDHPTTRVVAGIWHGCRGTLPSVPS